MRTVAARRHRERKSDFARTKFISNVANIQAANWTIGSKPKTNSSVGRSRAGMLGSRSATSVTVPPYRLMLIRGFWLVRSKGDHAVPMDLPRSRQSAG